jgi:hypothetical protein
MGKQIPGYSVIIYFHICSAVDADMDGGHEPPSGKSKNLMKYLNDRTRSQIRISLLCCRISHFSLLAALSLSLSASLFPLQTTNPIVSFPSLVLWVEATEQPL